MQVRPVVGGAMFAVGIALSALGIVRSVSAAERPGTVPTEADVRRFVATIGDGYRSGDATRLIATLHPNVRTLYGEKQCRALFDERKDPAYAFAVRDVRGPGRWTFTADGKTFPAEWAYEIDATRTRGSGTDDVTLHVSLLKDELVWFSDCGDPVI